VCVTGPCLIEMWDFAVSSVDTSMDVDILGLLGVVVSLGISIIKMPKSKEPCSQEACDIQTCLVKNNFITERCFPVIEALQACCEKCNSKSTHCASLSGLLGQRKKKL
ncbi:hypothetical protein GOP47_0029344, partial [Adiantum capillus-veneris]